MFNKGLAIEVGYIMIVYMVSYWPRSNMCCMYSLCILPFSESLRDRLTLHTICRVALYI